MLYCAPLKVSVIFVSLNFLDSFCKNIQTSNSMKIRLREDELFRADGRAGSSFVQFCERV